MEFEPDIMERLHRDFTAAEIPDVLEILGSDEDVHIRSRSLIVGAKGSVGRIRELVELIHFDWRDFKSALTHDTDIDDDDFVPSFRMHPKRDQWACSTTVFFMRHDFELVSIRTTLDDTNGTVVEGIAEFVRDEHRVIIETANGTLSVREGLDQPRSYGLDRPMTDHNKFFGRLLSAIVDLDRDAGESTASHVDPNLSP